MSSVSVPSVTVILLNWNARALLARSLPPLLAQDYDDYRVVLVDNASTDGSPSFVHEQFPEVEIVQNERNLGFSAGNNAALRRLQSDVAVLVNPDVIVANDWLRQLVDGLTGDKAIGIAGGKLYYPCRERLQHAGGLMHFPQAMPGYLGLNEADGPAGLANGQHDALRDVDYVVGAALAVRREVLQQIGLLDEGFFLYFEDADLCFRARRAGYRVVYVPGAVAEHEESALTGKESPAYLAWFHSSRWRFLLKHAPQEVLLQQTIGAEQRWLATQTAGAPLARAYAHVLRRFSQALQARVEHGEAALDEEAADQIAAALSGLYESAYEATLAPSFNRLRRRQALQPFIYRSRLPLLGALIAGLRRAWGAVAARPVTADWAAQQGAFNRAVVQELDGRREQLAAHDAGYARAARRLSAIRRELATLLARLEGIDRRLAQLEAREDES